MMMRETGGIRKQRTDFPFQANDYDDQVRGVKVTISEPLIEHFGPSFGSA
jgi:hypothetical protein